MRAACRHWRRLSICSSHDACNRDAKAFVVSERRLEEGDGALSFIVGFDLAEGDTRRIGFDAFYPLAHRVRA